MKVGKVKWNKIKQNHSKGEKTEINRKKTERERKKVNKEVEINEKKIGENDSIRYSKIQKK